MKRWLAGLGIGVMGLAACELRGTSRDEGDVAEAGRQQEEGPHQGVVQGYIAGVGRDAVQVETEDGETIELQLGHNLEVREGGAPGGLESLVEGSPVRAGYSVQEGTTRVAEEIEVITGDAAGEGPDRKGAGAGPAEKRER